MDLHDYEDVAENYDLYLDAMYKAKTTIPAFRNSIWILPGNTGKTV